MRRTTYKPVPAPRDMVFRGLLIALAVELVGYAIVAGLLWNYAHEGGAL
jgi:hypothetical protein